VEKPANQDKELKNGSEAESERNAKEKSAEVERKRTLERRNEKEGASRNQTEQKSNTYSKKLTPEERQKRLEQMQADAKTHQKDRLEEIKRAKDIELKEKEQLLERAKNSDTIKKIPLLLTLLRVWEGKFTMIKVLLLCRTDFRGTGSMFNELVTSIKCSNMICTRKC